jgi:FkbM family methyltransferase
MWTAAAKVRIAKAFGWSEVSVRRAGLSIACGTGDGQGSFCAIAGPAYEAELLWLIDELQPRDTFVDIGANIGIYSLHAARRLKGGGTIVSLEPSPDAMRLLERNIQLNGFTNTIVPIHAAASRAAGQLYLAGTPKKWNSLQLHEHPPGIPIQVTTIDSVLSKAQSSEDLHFLKIDAEGVETDVLEGARESIERTWPKIIFENSINRSDELPTEWLRRKGYIIHAVGRRNQLAPVAPADYQRHTNLVAVHPRSRNANIQQIR